MKHDVIVVGSGPGGSLAAETVARAGLNVLLIERLQTDAIHEKPCGGGIPNQVLTDFNIKPEGIVEKRIKGSIIIAPDGEEFTLESMGEDYGWNLHRSVFDKHLRDRAVDAGAHLLDSTRAVDIIMKDDFVKGVVVKGERGLEEQMAPIVIDAAGVGSQLVVKAGLRKKWDVEKDLGQCAVAFVEGYNPENKDRDEFYNQFFLSSDIAPNAYAWIFPLNNHVANVGLGLHRTKGINPMDYLLEFLKSDHLKGKFSNEKIIWRRNHPVPLNGIKGKTFSNGIMIVGDAAGFVSPILGEGIIYAMWTGKMAGETAIEAHEHENFSREILKRYKKKYKARRFPSIFSTHKALRDLLMADVEYNVTRIIHLAQKDKEAQQIIESALTGETREISPELMTRALLLIKRALKKE